MDREGWTGSGDRPERDGSPRCRKGRVRGGQSTYGSTTHGADGTADQRPFPASSQGAGHRSGAATNQCAVDGALVRIVGAASQCEKAQNQACATHYSSFRSLGAERGEQRRVSCAERMAVGEGREHKRPAQRRAKHGARNRAAPRGKLIQINAEWRQRGYLTQPRVVGDQAK